MPQHPKPTYSLVQVFGFMQVFGAIQVNAMTGKGKIVTPIAMRREHTEAGEPWFHAIAGNWVRRWMR